jgi:hypothetical protein
MDTNVSKLQNWNINKKIINHNYDNHIESKSTLVKFIIKDIKVGKPNHLSQQINFQLICNNKNYPLFPRIVTR